MKQAVAREYPEIKYPFFSSVNGLLARLTKNQILSLLALTIGLLQCAVRIGAIDQYGFHQDELLYIALSEHLSWGYSETPPFIAIVGKISGLLFGTNLVAFRIIPCCCAVAIVYFTGKITMRLGGGALAVVLACCGVGFSSAFLASGALFIPQVFDELTWVLLAYIMILWLQEKKDYQLILAGLIVGIGLYMKYTIILYVFGLLIGLSWSSPILRTKAFWYGVLLVVAMLLPHMIWQIGNGFPALGHYQELKKTQLVYLSKGDFIIQQLALNGTGIVIWSMAPFLLLKYHELKLYRFLLYAFGFVMLLLFLLNGKAYYGLGAFPPLFAIGALFWEKIMDRITQFKKAMFISVLVVPNLCLAVVVLPYLPISTAAKVFKWTYENLGIHYPLKWEDQKIHNMNQNYADMIGWDELAAKTSSIYKSIPAHEKSETVVFANRYGEAGALDHYQQDYALPKVISFSSSYSLWAPKDFHYKNIILVTDSLDTKAIRGCKILKREKINSTYARIRGMGIYLIEDVDSKFKAWYTKNRTASNVFQNSSPIF